MLTSQNRDYKFNVKVDLDHLLLDGGWKRGEVDWLRWVEPRDTNNTSNAYLAVYSYIYLLNIYPLYLPRIYHAISTL